MSDNGDSAEFSSGALFGPWHSRHGSLRRSAAAAAATSSSHSFSTTASTMVGAAAAAAAAAATAAAGPAAGSVRDDEHSSSPGLSPKRGYSGLPAPLRSVVPVVALFGGWPRVAMSHLELSERLARVAADAAAAISFLASGTACPHPKLRHSRTTCLLELCSPAVRPHTSLAQHTNPLPCTVRSGGSGQGCSRCAALQTGAACVQIRRASRCRVCSRCSCSGRCRRRRAARGSARSSRTTTPNCPAPPPPPSPPTSPVRASGKQHSTMPTYLQMCAPPHTRTPDMIGWASSSTAYCSVATTVRVPLSVPHVCSGHR